MWRILLMGVVFIGLLQACAISKIPLPKTTIDSPNLDGGTVVSYQRSGGIIGLTDNLTIDEDGHCLLERRNLKREFDLPSGDLQHLRQAFENANFFNLNTQYLPANIGADRIEYIITYRTSGKQHTVRTMDGVIPEALTPVLTQLDLIISDNAK